MEGALSEAPSRGQHRTILMAAATTQRRAQQHAHTLYAVEEQAGNSNSPASVSGNSSQRSKAARQRRKTQPFPVSDGKMERRRDGGRARARAWGERERPRKRASLGVAFIEFSSDLSHAWISSNETVTAQKNKEGDRNVMRMRKGW